MVYKELSKTNIIATNISFNTQKNDEDYAAVSSSAIPLYNHHALIDDYGLGYGNYGYPVLGYGIYGYPSLGYGTYEAEDLGYGIYEYPGLGYRRYF
ncbi:hypothetical protein TNCV_4579691 [Trichonephila clavipes]|nr:hypothetical protein TNCV_4579691 [Trichonephila clavipes]